jgi:hypothetical protein
LDILSPLALIKINQARRKPYLTVELSVQLSAHDSSFSGEHSGKKMGEAISAAENGATDKQFKRLGLALRFYASQTC